MTRKRARSAAARPYYSALVSIDSTSRGDRRLPAAARLRRPLPPPRRPDSRVNTAIFALATGTLADRRARPRGRRGGYFATSGAASAFTIASQIPNLMSNLFAQAALSAAFVPVFTDLLQQGRKREAFKLASTLFWIILIALGRDDRARASWSPG